MIKKTVISATKIKQLLEGLVGNARLDASAIKNLISSDEDVKNLLENLVGDDRLIAGALKGVDTTEIYYCDMNLTSICKVNPNGDYNETLNDSIANIHSIAVYKDRLYFTVQLVGSSKIQSADLDGGNVADILTGMHLPSFITIFDEKIYWSNGIFGYIKRCDLDGGNIETIVNLGVAITGIDIYSSLEKIYWIKHLSDQVWRADLDGGDQELVVSGAARANGLSLDVKNEKIYWAEYDADKIRRSNLDGSNIQDICVASAPYAVRVDPYFDKIYFTEMDTNKLVRCDLDGGNREELVDSLDSPLGLTIYRAGGIKISGDFLVQGELRAGVLQIGGATGPKIANDSGDCVIQDKDGKKLLAIKENGEMEIFNDAGDRCAWFDNQGNLELLDTSQLASESLDETDFATHAKWDVTGDFDDTGGDAAYTHNTGVGTLTQLAANLAISGVRNAWYILKYDVSGAAGVIAAEITTSFALVATALDLTDGVNKTLLFKAAAAPTDFVVSATSSAGGFALDNVSLKQVIGGDLVANGAVEVKKNIEVKGSAIIGSTAMVTNNVYAYTFLAQGGGIYTPMVISLALSDISIRIQSSTNKIEHRHANLRTAFFSNHTFGQFNNDDCGIERKINISAETTLAGASTTIANVAPQNAKIIASGIIVSELITSGDGGSTFDIAYNASAASQAVAAGQAFAKNTKTEKFYDSNASSNIATAQVDHVITPDIGTFSGGKVYSFCIYESLVAFDDLA